MPKEISKELNATAVGHVNGLMKGKDFISPNGWQHTLKQNITCETQGILYLLNCQSGAFYIG